MDLSKKRKADENGGAFPISGEPLPLHNFQLSPDDVRKILDPFTKDQLLEIVQAAIIRDPVTLAAVRTIADNDPAQRKLFVRGLGWETTTDKLQGIFSAFGEVAEAIVITDKGTGKSKGYGFVTFKHIDGAILALKEPNKKIDGRITVTQLAATGNTGPVGGIDVSTRKIYVGNIPFEISSERLLNVFSQFGEIEEGPLGFDKQTGKAKGFAFFVYKTEEGARASLIEPMKIIDGHQVNCKYATDGKKGRPGMVNAGEPAAGSAGGMNSGYGYPGGVGPYGGGFGGGMQMPPNAHQNPLMNSGPGFGNQPAGQSYYGGPGTGAGYGGVGGGNGQQYGASVMQPGGPNNMGSSSMYRMPSTSAGMPSGGGYQDGGNYGLPASGFGQTQLPQQSGPRVPPGGMYQGMPYY